MVAVGINKTKSNNNNVLLPAVPQHFSIGFVLGHLFQAVIFYYCFKSIANNIIMNAKNTNNSGVTQSLAFYGVYHRTPYNQLLHFFGVPLIIWTMMIFAAHLPFTNHNAYFVIDIEKTLPFLRLRRHRVTWATIWVALYTVFYISMDIPGALMFGPWLYYMYYTSVEWSAQDQYNHLSRTGKTRWYGTGRLLLWAFVIHITSWYIQIHPGHAILEGATPASLVNLGAALTSAPLFAFYEGIWFLGFRSELHQRVLAQVAIYTQQLCEEGANLRVCSSL